MMSKRQILQSSLSSAAAVILLAACGGGGSGNGNNDQAVAPQNQTVTIGSQDANAEAVSINDPDALVADIEALFGGPNDAPVQTGDDESLQDVLNRLP